MEMEIKKGTLYIVPTPIGNMADITLRAIDVLGKVDLIGVEDTRNSGKLLKFHKIESKMISYHKFNESSRTDFLIDKLDNNFDIAIISDAGTPGISDPASKLITEALNNNIEVITLPGATAFVPAVISSGLNCSQFYFAGFLPDKKTEQCNILNNIQNLESTLIFYEAPHRIFKTIALLREILGNRKLSISREISKLYETHYRTTFDEVLMKPESIKIKGEFVLVVEGYKPEKVSDEKIIQELKILLEKGYSKKEAVQLIKYIFPVSRNRIYRLVLKVVEKL